MKWTEGRTGRVLEWEFLWIQAQSAISLRLFFKVKGLVKPYDEAHDFDLNSGFSTTHLECCGKAPVRSAEAKVIRFHNRNFAGWDSATSVDWLSLATFT